MDTEFETQQIRKPAKWLQGFSRSEATREGARREERKFEA